MASEFSGCIRRRRPVMSCSRKNEGVVRWEEEDEEEEVMGIRQLSLFSIPLSLSIGCGRSS